VVKKKKLFKGEKKKKGKLKLFISDYSPPFQNVYCFTKKIHAMKKFKKKKMT
jgi:hypothetical protein